MPPLFEHVTIAGVGLIGGSLALAGRAAALFGEVIGLGRGAANLQLARQRGIIDRSTSDPQEAVRQSDLVVLSVPISSLQPVVTAMAPALRPGTLVTDVASVKAAVLRDVEPLLPQGIEFVGGHPIAGTESSGAAAAEAELFRGRRCILTPGERSTPKALDRVRALWEGVGMRVDVMDPVRHDAVLAWVSHLPHALAFAVVEALQHTNPQFGELGGPSFASLTRVAASAPQTWTDIFLANAAALDRAIAETTVTLGSLRALIAAGDSDALSRWLESARAAHLAWRSKAARGSSPHE